MPLVKTSEDICTNGIIGIWLALLEKLCGEGFEVGVL